MKYRIEISPEKKLIGKHLTMSLANNRTAELWKSFMPRRKEIKHTINSVLIDMKIYGTSFDARNFNPQLEFEKWVAVEVSEFADIPEGMETCSIKGGMYAVFDYKGSSQAVPGPFHFIFGTWLPNSEYELDTRGHFELLGEKYKNNDPDSEEEIWIPIRKKLPDTGY